jgi:hypothetical protein
MSVATAANRPVAMSGEDKAKSQRGKSDEEIDERAVDDREKLFAGRSRLPQRVERQLRRLPHKIADSDSQQISALRTEPVWGDGHYGSSCLE